MFEDQTVELLPARTVMTAFMGGGGRGGRGSRGSNGVKQVAISVVAGNKNYGDGDQINVAASVNINDSFNRD